RALDDRDRAGVAHREPLADGTGDEEPATRRPVQAGVAGEHRHVGRVVLRGPDGDEPAAHALADVVVRLAGEVQLDAVGEERAEALAGRTGEADAGGAPGRQLAELESDGEIGRAPG